MVTETPERARLGMPAPVDVPAGGVVSITRPVERYGAPRAWSRPLLVALVALLALAGGGWLVWAALHHAQQPVTGRLRTFEVVDAGTVAATIDVQREPGRAAVCLLEAQAADHLVVGEREVRIAAGPRAQVTRTYRITTERRATNAVLDGCRLPG
jgi:hypothetical protein